MDVVSFSKDIKVELPKRGPAHSALIALGSEIIVDQNELHSGAESAIDLMAPFENETQIFIVESIKVPVPTRLYPEVALIRSPDFTQRERSRLLQMPDRSIFVDAMSKENAGSKGLDLTARVRDLISVQFPEVVQNLTKDLPGFRVSLPEGFIVFGASQARVEIPILGHLPLMDYLKNSNRHGVFRVTSTRDDGSQFGHVVDLDATRSMTVPEGITKSAAMVVASYDGLGVEVDCQGCQSSKFDMGGGKEELYVYNRTAPEMGVLSFRIRLLATGEEFQDVVVVDEASPRVIQIENRPPVSKNLFFQDRLVSKMRYWSEEQEFTIDQVGNNGVVPLAILANQNYQAIEVGLSNQGRYILELKGSGRDVFVPTLPDHLIGEVGSLSHRSKRRLILVNQKKPADIFISGLESGKDLQNLGSQGLYVIDAPQDQAIEGALIYQDGSQVAFYSVPSALQRVSVQILN